VSLGQTKTNIASWESKTPTFQIKDNAFKGNYDACFTPLSKATVAKRITKFSNSARLTQNKNESNIYLTAKLP
jgi:hypothetical protein